MTPLERIVQAHVQNAAVTTVSRATETIGEELARELLKDPAFRAELKALAHGHFTATMTALMRTGTPKQRRPRKARRKKATR